MWGLECLPSHGRLNRMDNEENNLPYPDFSHQSLYMKNPTRSVFPPLPLITVIQSWIHTTKWAILKLPTLVSWNWLKRNSTLKLHLYQFYSQTPILMSMFKFWGLGFVFWRCSRSQWAAEMCQSLHRWAEVTIQLHTPAFFFFWSLFLFCIKNNERE